MGGSKKGMHHVLLSKTVMKMMGHRIVVVVVPRRPTRQRRGRRSRCCCFLVHHTRPMMISLGLVAPFPHCVKRELCPVVVCERKVGVVVVEGRRNAAAGAGNWKVVVG